MAKEEEEKSDAGGSSSKRQAAMAVPKLLDFEGTFPRCGDGVFVAPGAMVIGDVRIGEMSSVWYNTVIRGDVASIEIGARTNIQDLCMIHVTGGVHETVIGDEVTVGHKAILHGCRVGNRCLIGMGAIVLDGAVIEENCLIAAGSLIPPGMHVPAGSLVMGSPGKVRRALSDQDLQKIRISAAHYVDLARRHQAGAQGGGWQPLLG